MQKNVVGNKRDGFCSGWKNTSQRFLKILSRFCMKPWNVFTETLGGVRRFPDSSSSRVPAGLNLPERGFAFFNPAIPCNPWNFVLLQPVNSQNCSTKFRGKYYEVFRKVLRTFSKTTMNFFGKFVELFPGIFPFASPHGLQSAGIFYL